MSEIDDLRLRVADLEALLEAAKREHQVVVRGAEIADAQLSRLREYLKPAVSREAITNVLGLTGDDVGEISAALWRHVAPAYKVDELTELALRALRGER